MKNTSSKWQALLIWRKDTVYAYGLLVHSIKYTIVIILLFTVIHYVIYFTYRFLLVSINPLSWLAFILFPEKTFLVIENDGWRLKDVQKYIQNMKPLCVTVIGKELDDWAFSINLYLFIPVYHRTIYKDFIIIILYPVVL